ncbi:MAG: hypothetical protein ACKPJD_26235 [Planctomycetaceae bacterium]
MLQEGDGCFDGLQSMFCGVSRLAGVTRWGRAGCGVMLRLRGHGGMLWAAIVVTRGMRD